MRGGDEDVCTKSNGCVESPETAMNNSSIAWASWCFCRPLVTQETSVLPSLCGLVSRDATPDSTAVHK
ncbi:uncharacterized protein CANTADRAFT_334372 [Suhomyces tanzawaensis NRRL Y-17324]|uniref:Uncharacterized protein n=1 Tax=Suhomyces tanzawaensis NRRL Y-17324 TaxID=984487 RepID=A0A1E4SBC1_9ASCO|nr:uncharacterized protein CANTADRAFT_334372 [Suhomyces tanzawaensis NRRL Y-17324]ODV76827.1 hypothetical protein CANTADRAFT_334372 [Suhomyces tanzawaensis NRRL Y-17324]